MSLLNNQLQSYYRLPPNRCLFNNIAFFMQVVKTHSPGKKVWLGGLAPAWAGGTSNLSDTYAAGFL